MVKFNLPILLWEEKGQGIVGKRKFSISNSAEYS